MDTATDQSNCWQTGWLNLLSVIQAIGETSRWTKWLFVSYVTLVDRFVYRSDLSVSHSFSQGTPSTISGGACGKPRAKCGDLSVADECPLHAGVEFMTGLQANRLIAVGLSHAVKLGAKGPSGFLVHPTCPWWSRAP